MRTRSIALVVLLISTAFADAGKQTFTSADGVFQISFPTDYALYTSKTMEDADLHSFIPLCDGHVLVCLVYPQRYKDTNFEAAAFQVTEVENATNATDCSTPTRGPADAELSISSLKTFAVSTREPKRVIHGVSFVHGETGGAATGHQITADLFRAFHGGKCHELSINITQNTFVNYETGTLREFTSKTQNA